MENNKLIVNDVNGNSVEINVYDIIENKDINKKYIIYDTKESEEDSMFISILDEKEDYFTLKKIEDENELKEVEEYFLKTNGENGDI